MQPLDQTQVLLYQQVTCHRRSLSQIGAANSWQRQEIGALPQECSWQSGM